MSFSLLQSGFVTCPACLGSRDAIDREIQPGDTYGDEPCDRCGKRPCSECKGQGERERTVRVGPNDIEMDAPCVCIFCDGVGIES